MVSEPISIERLQKAILIWDEMMNCYQRNMADIKTEHKLTWWARPSYWTNEKMFHRSFTGLIKRRIQLQTAIKEQKETV